MKKIALSLATIFALIFLCGCSGAAKKDEIALVEPGYSCGAEVYYGGEFSFAAGLSVVGGGVFGVEIKKPEVLSGLTFTFDNGQMAVEYGGLKSDSLKAGMYGGFAEILDGVFLKITAGPSVAKLSGDEYTFLGVSNGEDFVLTVNDEGFPTKLKIENLGFEAEFSDWQY